MSEKKTSPASKIQKSTLIASLKKKKIKKSPPKIQLPNLTSSEH